MFFSQHDAETTLALVRAAGFEVLRAEVETQVEGDREVSYLWVLARRGSEKPREPIPIRAMIVPVARGGLLSIACLAGVLALAGPSDAATHKGKTSQGKRVEVRVRGDRVSPRRWKGVFKPTAVVKRNGNHVATCDPGKIRWHARR